jgi:hypothetical protein
LKRALPVLFPYAVFVLLAFLSWNRWIEPYVDSGRELMVPWRISQGEALYRDVRFYYGPLAPVLAAAVDSLAGRSLPARIALAAIIALAHLEALRRLATRFLTTGPACLATALAVGLFFFLRPGGCHLFPYSLDTSVAVAAAMWALVLAGRPRPGRRIFLSISLLVALLARVETGIAVGVAALLPALSHRPGSDRRRGLALVLAPVVIAALAYALFSARTATATLRQEGWLTAFFLPLEFRRVYSSFSGLDRPGLRLAELALAVILIVLATGWLVTVTYLSSRAGSPRLTRAIELAGLATLAVVAAIWLRPPAEMADSLSLFPPLIRPLPVFVVAGGLWRLLQRLRRRTDDGPFRTVPDEVLFLSVVFSGRLILAAGYVGPYSAFYLPLAAVVAVAGIFRIADLAARWPGLSRLPRLVAGALIVFLGARALALAATYRHPGWSRVDTPAGSLFLLEPYATASRQALNELARRTPAHGTVVGFPEVGFLQYVLGRENTLPEDQFFPGHLDASAEGEAIRSIERRPPDAFVYINVLTIGHGAAAFGSDYLQGLDAAVRRLSRPVAAFGPGAGPEPRIGDPDFFIQIRVPARRAP